jgi:hypothetical protein
MTVQLSPSQELAQDDFRDFLWDEQETEFILTGFAGSGKSFLVDHLVKLTQEEDRLERLIDKSLPVREYIFTATTNKAANVLKGMLGMKTMTIHRLLGLTIQADYKTGKEKLIQKNATRSLSNCLVFLDEGSMVTHDLLGLIREAVKQAKNCKIIFIGDSYQLPPVKHDYCPLFRQNIRTACLTEIQRQAAGSPIIQLSTKYREMQDDHTLLWPEIENNAGVTHYTDSDLWFEAIKKGFLEPHASNDLRVLAWTNKRTIAYNKWIRGFSGYTEEYCVDEMVITNKPLIDQGGGIMASTDSVHKIVAVTPAIVQDIKGYRITIANPDGNITGFQPSDWDEAQDLLRKFAKDQCWPDFYEIKNTWFDLRAIHAQTVHKSQGSTYKDVYVDLTNLGKCNNWRDVARMAYVAITRASNHVYIFGQLDERYNKSAQALPMAAFTPGARNGKQ